MFAGVRQVPANGLFAVIDMAYIPPVDRESMRPFPSDTICAIATAPGHGGIGVVRVSGSSSRNVLAKVWKGQIDAKDFEPRHLYLGEVAGDRAMAVLMKAPRTYTGEDVVEFSAHGSPVILGRILDACVKSGARPAGPGEFTRRAFLAGKLDLAQAEAVADLINATTERAARLAEAQLSGALSAEVKALSEKLADIRAEIEAGIDFPEEEMPPFDRDAIMRRLGDIIASMKKLSATFKEGRLVREGAKVAIVGRPNAGKSSIFNRLAGQERAIVHHEAGTTRDVVEETVILDGVSFRLRDTAGLRDEASEVEALGIGRTHSEMESADVVLAVIDGSRRVEDSTPEMMGNRNTLMVINKSDLPSALADKDLKNLSPIFASAKTGEGIDNIIRRLKEIASSNVAFGEGAVVSNARHKDAIDSALGALAKSWGSISTSEPPECVASHLRDAQDSLGSITGEVTTDDLLDKIFSKFCIGK